MVIQFKMCIVLFLSQDSGKNIEMWPDAVLAAILIISLMIRQRVWNSMDGEGEVSEQGTVAGRLATLWDGGS